MTTHVMHFIQMLIIAGMFLLVIPLISLVMVLITNYFKDRAEVSKHKFL